MSEGEKPTATEPAATVLGATEPNASEGPPLVAATATAETASAEVATSTATPRFESDDPDGERVEVEPVSVDPPRAPHAAHHLPPPPPSIRVRGATSSKARLEVAGDPKLAQDLMTRKLFTVGPDDTIAHLEEHMQAFRFRHLPVVEDRKLVGLITHEDLLRASASLFSAKAKEQDELIHQLPAKHIMQRELVTVRPTETLEQVAVVMWEAKLGCVLITDEDKTLVGIITEGDFIRLAHHFLVQGR